MISDVLSESTKARAKSIELQGVKFADDLARALLKHAIAMEKYYGDLKAAVDNDNPCEKTLKGIMKKVLVDQDWYKQAEVRIEQKHVVLFYRMSTFVLVVAISPNTALSNHSWHLTVDQ